MPRICLYANREYLDQHIVWFHLPISGQNHITGTLMSPQPTPTLGSHCWSSVSNWWTTTLWLNILLLALNHPAVHFIIQNFIPLLLLLFSQQPISFWSQPDYSAAIPYSRATLKGSPPLTFFCLTFPLWKLSVVASPAVLKLHFLWLCSPLSEVPLETSGNAKKSNWLFKTKQNIGVWNQFQFVL